MVNVLDIIFIAIAAFFTIRGLFRGLMREIASLVGVVAGYYVASNFAGEIAEYLKAAIHNPGIVHFLSYLVGFFGTMLFVMIFFWLFGKVIKLTPFGLIDLPTGALFGFGKAVLICSTVLIGLGTYLPDAGFYKESKSKELFKPATDFLAEHKSDDMKNYSPSAMADKFRQEKKEYMDNFLSGGGGKKDDSEDSMSDKSLEIIKKMGESLKNLKKEE